MGKILSKKDKLTILEKSTKILETAKETEWCYVDATNVFEFKGKQYLISEKVREYYIEKKPSTHEDYTNESEMDFVLAVIHENNELKFYNLKYKEIEEVSVV